MSVGWILERGKEGETIVIYTDNVCAEFWMRKYKASNIYIALVWMLANFIRENRIHLIVKRASSKKIAADPLSRMFPGESLKKERKEAEEDWEIRAGRWSIPKSGTVVDFDWEGLYAEVLEWEEL